MRNMLSLSRYLFPPTNMALPPSFESPDEYFDECVSFLQEYKYLHNFPNTDILVANVLEYIEADDLETFEISDKNIELPANFLNSFLPKLAKLKAVYNEFVEVECLEDLVTVPLSAKKRHEIVYLAKEVKGVCEENACDAVVDFGSGLGYLDQIIFETTQLKVLGLECNASHYVGAKTRQGKYHKDSAENVKYIKHTVNEQSNIQIEAFLRDKFLNCNGFCITGLHACADLTVVALNLFLKMEEAKAMVIMPCCYHKMEREGEKFRNFPLSQSLKRVFAKFNGWGFIGVPFMRLGAQPPCLGEGLEDSVFNLLARAALQQYACRHNVILKRRKRKAVKTKTMERHFETYIRDACEGFRLIHRNELTDEVHKVDSCIVESSHFDLDELRTIWREMTDSMVFKKAALFVLLQNYLQPVVENFILYDRVVYLKENGLTNCKINRIVNERISPRCLALLACK